MLIQIETNLFQVWHLKPYLFQASKIAKIVHPSEYLHPWTGIQSSRWSCHASSQERSPAWDSSDLEVEHRSLSLNLPLPLPPCCPHCGSFADIQSLGSLGRGFCEIEVVDCNWRPPCQGWKSTCARGRTDKLTGQVAPEKVGSALLNVGLHPIHLPQCRQGGGVPQHGGTVQRWQELIHHVGRWQPDQICVNKYVYTCWLLSYLGVQI